MSNETTTSAKIINTSISDAVVGLTSSSLTSLILHPVDVVRLAQISNGTSLCNTIKKIYNSKNIVASSTSCRQYLLKPLNFYRAVPISIIANGMTYSIYFPLNTYLKNEMSTHINNKYLLYMFATIPPSLFSMTVCNPLWTIKAKQISNRCGKMFSLRHTVRHIYVTSGFSGFYRGLMFGYINSLNGMLSFTMYDIFKDLLWQHNNRLNSLDYIMCSVVSKTIATVVCYPILVMRIRQQVYQLSVRETLKNMFSSAYTTKHTTVLYTRSMFNGLLFTLAHQLPKNAILLVLYEFLREIF